jgi:hypothetical protein
VEVEWRGKDKRNENPHPMACDTGFPARQIEYQLMVNEQGLGDRPSFDGFVWEHLQGPANAMPNSGPDSPGVRLGYFDDQHTTFSPFGPNNVFWVQTFSAVLADGVDVGLYVPGYTNADGNILIFKNNNYISINSDPGGRLSGGNSGVLIRGTYNSCH